MFKACAAPQDAFIDDVVTIISAANLILQQEYQTYCLASEQFDVQIKTDHSPVTQADLKANAFIVHALGEKTPDIPVLSEEGDIALRQQWSKCWLLDPLDGTKEFLKKRPEFTINLSLIEHGQTLFSVIAVPAQQIIYLGYTHQKPYKYDQKNQQWQSYEASMAKQQKLKLGLSHNSRQAEYQQLMQILQQTQMVEPVFSGSAYKFCMMLEGEIDLYPRFHPTCEWDTSAGQGLLESVGGGLITLDAKPFRYNVRDTVLNSGFLAFISVDTKAIALNALNLMKKSGMG
ncbi:3'(2'),5'-bisphosphate nucleotidase CysQ [Acinetobacter sp. MD2(2019)]|uniref:3'(2'),5'-bisphosphate nucleotidase CysQ family protein n=1 Tax=Acinetobacter sp. MD2(2019) TaxID=2605273 RepID=UPI002D1F6B48|nr:3'(2'),5'-bisphosphate nucleotidase CysQ [Acinetobacter sp. MD2(2019)]MEB3754182.1 3'(2'),5'-bisphosphate nucleotidase CysQ [Acinetobacter sp. MD2(2019)]